jgi:hypothetical protein
MTPDSPSDRSQIGRQESTAANHVSDRLPVLEPLSQVAPDGRSAGARYSSRQSWPLGVAPTLAAIALLAIATGIAAFARPFVGTYGASSPATSGDDTFGRIGFILLLAATLAVIFWLDRHADRPATQPELYVPSNLVLLLFSALSLTWVLYSQLVLDAFARGRFGYLEWLNQVLTLAETRGIWNIWTPYPQGTQELLLGLHALAASLGAWASSDVWSSYTFFRLGFQAVFLTIPAIVTVWLTARLGRVFGRASQTIVTIALAFSFAAIYYGAATAYVTDPLPVALTVGALLLILRQRYALAGAAVGLGAAFKLFPLLLVPALLVSLPHRTGVRLLGATTAVLVLCLGPAATASLDNFLSPFRWQSSRPPWQSWFAFANWLTNAPHNYTAPYFQDASAGYAFGWVFTGITPVIPALQTPVPSAPLRWEDAVSLVGTTVSLLLVVSARRASPRSMIRWTVFCLAAFFIWSIGWSPQFELYLVPLVLLVFENPLAGVGAGVLLQAVTFLDYPLLLPWATFYGGSVVWLDWAAVLSRYLVLSWLCLYVVRHEGSVQALTRRARRVIPPLAVASMLFTSAAAVILLPDPASAAPAPFQCATVQRTNPSDQPPGPDPSRDWSMPSGWFFTQAGGFSIVDDASARFWSEYRRLGDWRVLGFPASRRFSWHNHLSQVTQRAVLQWSPVTGQADFANVLDLLHEQGLDDQLFSQDQIPAPAAMDEAGLPYETIAERRLQWLDGRPAIKQTYCDTPGGADPVLLWGLPTSVAVNVGNPGTVYVMRTQRAAFQEWVDGAPWAAPGAVTVVLAGDLAKDYNLIPPEAVIPEPDSAH